MKPPSECLHRELAVEIAAAAFPACPFPTGFSAHARNVCGTGRISHTSPKMSSKARKADRIVLGFQRRRMQPVGAGVVEGDRLAAVGLAGEVAAPERRHQRKADDIPGPGARRSERRRQDEFRLAVRAVLRQARDGVGDLGVEQATLDQREIVRQRSCSGTGGTIGNDLVILEFGEEARGSAGPPSHRARNGCPSAPPDRRSPHGRR